MADTKYKLQKSKAAVTERSKSNLITKPYSSASSPLLYMTAMETNTFVFQSSHFLLLGYTSTMFKVLKQAKLARLDQKQKV